MSSEIRPVCPGTTSLSMGAMSLAVKSTTTKMEVQLNYRTPVLSHVKNYTDLTDSSGPSDQEEEDEQEQHQEEEEEEESEMADEKKKEESEDGLVRIFFTSHSFTASTVLKVQNTTTCAQVRQLISVKTQVPAVELKHYVIIMVFPNGKEQGGKSARTLQDAELLLPLQDQFTTSTRAATRVKIVPQNQSIEEELKKKMRPRHRIQQPVKFIFKDTRLPPIELEEEFDRTGSARENVFSIPDVLGQGLYRGYLKKASMKDSNIWRKRWFVIQDDRLYYCKSEGKYRDVTSVTLAKARVETCSSRQTPHCFYLYTSRRAYQLRAENAKEMHLWCQTLKYQIRLSSENNLFNKADEIIGQLSTDNAKKTDQAYHDKLMLNVESLKQQHDESEKASNLVTLYWMYQDRKIRKVFEEFFRYDEQIGMLCEAWYRCEKYRIFNSSACNTSSNSCSNINNNGAPSSYPELKTRSRSGSGQVANKFRTPQEAWEYIKWVLNTIIPRLQDSGLGLVFDDDVLSELKELVQSNFTYPRRLSYALDTTESIQEYPPITALEATQKYLFYQLAKQPCDIFFQTNGYHRLVHKLIGK